MRQTWVRRRAVYMARGHYVHAVLIPQRLAPMHTWTKPALTPFGTVADLTRGKATSGTDSLVGSIVSSGGDPCDLASGSRDCVAVTIQLDPA